MRLPYVLFKYLISKSRMYNSTIYLNILETTLDNE